MPLQDNSEVATASNHDSARPNPDRPNDERYDAQRVETKWVERWQSDSQLYAAEPHSTKKKYYVLEMLPYPSGALHMGLRLARGKRGDSEPDSTASVDPRQHRQNEGADEAPRLRL